MARLYPKSLYKGATRPILRAEVLYRNQNDDVYRNILAVQSGAYKDVQRPSVNYTNLSALTAGSRTGGQVSIRGGSL